MIAGRLASRVVYYKVMEILRVTLSILCMIHYLSQDQMEGRLIPGNMRVGNMDPIRMSLG